ncbi:uncharacterized protein LAESUDRAFT_738628 [Laetiporus sulphureus 93-53]|uniref:C3H1-type domain-containing protein n=1 Tax=Laetiporus sulphureus 93-53 TaxID=1314785 RepID=A0A165CG44_9APHY|nr:uncharacterized protein LAESUDRAFT_738628 [Laetiporus sulphureus 93-53]KZT02748.1 hypothetical protein LAESUDRAFT_738628 [Laetiporus sulphureus 93-53]
MPPTPISPSAVHIILQYIAPPSQLTQSIPPHLLSKSLLRRQHFLQLSPDNPLEYLCWPGSADQREHTVELLENVPRNDDPVDYPVQYTQDEEQTFAHVDLSSGRDEGVRLVFEWDDVDGWKYHDASLMPFPPGSHSVLLDSLGPHHERQSTLPASSHGQVMEGYSSDFGDDDYWNAYGSQDDGTSLEDRHLNATKDGEAGTEDAYWARYSSVHGTADSTQPSPPQLKRRLPRAGYDHETGRHSTDPMRFLTGADPHSIPLSIPSSVIPRPNLHSKWDPASPRTLASLLAALPPRASLSPKLAPSFDEVDDFGSDVPSPTVGGSTESHVSDTALLQNESNSPVPVLDVENKWIDIENDFEGGRPVKQKNCDSDEAGIEVVALRDGIRGLTPLLCRGLAKVMSEDDLTTTSRADLETCMYTLHTHGRIPTTLEALFHKTVTRNVALETRVEELERELAVWKAALKTADEDNKTLNKTIYRLERSIGSLREDNPLILCLIDGDGNIFSPELLAMGQVGGRQAAMLLTKGITDYLDSIDSPDDAMLGRAQFWLTIYCNKSGLQEALTQNDVCTAEQFEAFFIGFNQATPLFSMVDVGNGKEAADAKIKEFLRVFTRFPQTSRVFFGGAHDNGYTSTLNYLHNEGLLDKVILLRGYKELAYEIKGLELPYIEIEGLFLTKKLFSQHHKKASAPNTAGQTVQMHESEKQRSKSITPSRGNPNASPLRKPRQLDSNQRPPPCNFYYLAECKQGQNCRFAHDYVLLPDQLMELRENARKWPCPFVNRGQQCHLGNNCVMGHYCPKGARCSFAKQGKCKFKTAQKQAAPRKRKVSAIEKHEDDNVDASPTKSARIENTGSGEETVLRRSGRNRGKTINYNGDSFERTGSRLASVEPGIRKMEAEPRSANKRVHDPKTFGAIPRIAVGTWWETRPWVAGISGGSEGAYSIALSGGYEDDVDLGEGFTFTGAGGRDLRGTTTAPKNLRTAPQSCDQSFENRLNKALQISCQTKKPVRVIRGYKLNSPYAPSEGYRYDGLYTVEKRVPGQPPLQLAPQNAETNTDTKDEVDEVADIKPESSDEVTQ